jgi:hypothetical protein
MKLIRVKFKNRKKSFEYYKIYIELDLPSFNGMEVKSENNYTLDDIAVMFSLSLDDVKKLIY